MQNTSKRKRFDFGTFGKLMKFVKPFRTYLYLAILLGILLAILTPVRPYLINITVNTVTHKNTVLSPILSWLLILPKNFSLGHFIIVISIFQVILLIVETIIRFAFSFITAWLGQCVINDLRKAVFGKVLNLNLSQFDKTPIGTLTTRTINDIESINDVFSDGFIPIIADMLTIVFTLATMFYLNVSLTLISLATFPFLLVATYFFKESVNKSFTRVRNAVAALNAFVQEHLTGMFVVQSFAAEGRELNKFNEINKRHRDANISAILAYSIFFPVVELVLAISLGLLVWWVAKEQLQPGLLIMFILCINQIFRPLRIIADKFNVIQMGMVAADRVFLVMENEDELPESAEVDFNFPKFKGDIVFDKVWFAYNQENWVLKDISFQAKAGDTIALVGHTGSGKTTVTALLNRLYQHQKGQVLIDGNPVESYSLDLLRRNIGIVLQDVFLFSGSIIDNVTLRNDAITKEQVISAAKMLNIHEYILRLPGGYDFEVKERGNSLSLGQRQLISFLRAVLYNPSILIMDEATSSIDSESEQLVQNATEHLIQNRTSIIIAHRLSTIQKASLIVVFDKGTIVETGTHQQLLQNNGFYASLYKMQFSTTV